MKVARGETLLPEDDEVCDESIQTHQFAKGHSSFGHLRANGLDHTRLQVSITQQPVVNQRLIVRLLELVLPVRLGEWCLELLCPEREAARLYDLVRFSIARKGLAATKSATLETGDRAVIHYMNASSGVQAQLK